jgi:hypothetical protein
MILFRVVCGVGDVIATLYPVNRLIKVDFPTFVQPTRQT